MAVIAECKCRDHLIISLDHPLDGRELIDVSTGNTLEVRLAGNWSCGRTLGDVPVFFNGPGPEDPLPTG